MDDLPPFQLVVQLLAPAKAQALENNRWDAEDKENRRGSVHVRQIVAEALPTVFRGVAFREGRAGLRPFDVGASVLQGMIGLTIVHQPLRTRSDHEETANRDNVAETTQAAAPAKTTSQIRVILLGTPVTATGYEQGTAGAEQGGRQRKPTR